MPSFRRVELWHDGPADGALVLLHGFCGRPESWDDVVRALQKDRRIAGLTLPGHSSEARIIPQVGAQGFDDAVDGLARLLRGHGLKRVHLAGYSLGARVALRLMIRYPGMFARATLIGVNPGLEREEERAERRRQDGSWADMLRSQGIARFVEAWERQPVLAIRSAVPGPRLAAHRALRLSHDPIALASALELFSLGLMPSAWPELGRVTLPVRLIAGEHDAKFRAIAERMVGSMPEASLELIRDSGHNVLIEQPEALARAL